MPAFEFSPGANAFRVEAPDKQAALLTSSQMTIPSHDWSAFPPVGAKRSADLTEQSGKKTPNSWENDPVSSTASEWDRFPKVGASEREPRKGATFDFTSPEGRTYSVQGPEGATLEDAFRVLQQHLSNSPTAGVDRTDPRFQEGAMASKHAFKGVPVLGAYVDKASAAVSALAHPLTGAGEPGASYSERFAKDLAQEEAASRAFDIEHPIESGVSKAVGGTLALGPVGATATGARALGMVGGNLLTRGLAGGASGASIAAADAIARGESPTAPAVIGGIVGAAAPGAAKFAGSAIGALRSLRQPPLPANTVDIAGAPVRRSMGQLTGDLDTQMMEHGALRNTAGQREQQVAQDFFDAQNRELGNARESIARRFDPNGGIVAENPQGAAEQTAEAIRNRAAAAKADYQGKYDEFGNLPGEVHAGAFEGIRQKIKGDLTLGDNPVIIDDVTTPHASRALQDIENNIDRLHIQNRADPFGAPDPQNVVGISLKGIDQQRKRLLSFAKDASASGNAADSRAAKAVISSFDNRVQDAIDQGLFTGDQRAIDALKEARGSYANFRKTFTSQGAGDDVGRVLEKIVGKNGMQATPNEVANYLYGSSNIGATGLSVRLGQRLKGILGDSSPEWAGVKQGLWSRLVEATEGRTEFGPQKQSERIFEFLNGSGKMLSQIMFSNSERNLIAEYGKLVKQLVPKSGAVNYSNTATHLAKIMRGAVDGLFAAGGLHVAGPLGMAAGIAGHGAQKAIADVVRASRVARSLYGTPTGVAAEHRLREAIERLTTFGIRGAAASAA